MVLEFLKLRTEINDTITSIANMLRIFIKKLFSFVKVSSVPTEMITLFLWFILLMFIDVSSAEQSLYPRHKSSFDHGV